MPEEIILSDTTKIIMPDDYVPKQEGPSLPTPEVVAYQLHPRIYVFKSAVRAYESNLPKDLDHL